MNWICGLIRLWLLASIALTCLMINDMWNSCRYPITWEHDGLAAGFCDIPHLGHVLNGVAAALIVSFAIFIIGAGVVWVVRGFQRKVPQA
jgi:hypothetical protein